MMFLESRPDYFPVIYSSDAWGAVLRQLDEVAVGNVLCLEERGFTAVGRVYAIWLTIKEYLGFTNQTNPTRVGARLIQFFYLGAAHGFILENHASFGSVKRKILSGDLKVHDAVKKVLELMGNPEKVQRELINFYWNNQNILTPNFWDQWSAKQVVLREDAPFGAAHFALAKEQIRENPNLALQNFFQAARLYNSPDSKFYTEQLIQFFEFFVSLDPSRNAKMGVVYLLLAERVYLAGNFKKAYELFNLAWGLQVSFNPHQQSLFLTTAASIKDFSRSDEFSKIDSYGMDALSKERYERAMVLFGDHHAEESLTFTTQLFATVTLGYMVSPKEHCRKAFNFYRKAYFATSSNHHIIFQKILRAAEGLAENDLLHIYSQPHNWDTISHLLIVMKGKDLLDSIYRRGFISEFTQVISNIYYSKERTCTEEQCLHWIDEAIKCIGPIEKRLTTVSSRIKSTPADLLKKEGGFAFDVGAKLHFLRAEILKKQRMNNREIIEAYKLAANLAPENPFGASALFLVDNQETPNPQDSDIEGYRKFAIAWGASNQKESAEK